MGEMDSIDPPVRGGHESYESQEIGDRGSALGQQEDDRGGHGEGDGGVVAGENQLPAPGPLWIGEGPAAGAVMGEQKLEHLAGPVSHHYLPAPNQVISPRISTSASSSDQTGPAWATARYTLVEGSVSSRTEAPSRTPALHHPRALSAMSWWGVGMWSVLRVGPTGRGRLGR